MIVFFTYDLLPKRERLMPWRTIIEVCKVLQNSYNFEVAIYSLDAIPKNDLRYFEGISIYSENKNCYKDISFFKEKRIRHLFFPVGWRTSNKTLKSLKLFNGGKTAYFPGGYYDKISSLNAIRYIGFKLALPYLIEAFISKKRIGKFLQNANFNNVIALSELTKTKIIESGIQKMDVKCILPGKDILPDVKNEILPPINEKAVHKDQYFFLWVHLQK